MIIGNVNLQTKIIDTTMYWGGMDLITFEVEHLNPIGMNKAVDEVTKKAKAAFTKKYFKQRRTRKGNIKLFCSGLFRTTGDILIAYSPCDTKDYFGRLMIDALGNIHLDVIYEPSEF